MKPRSPLCVLLAALGIFGMTTLASAGPIFSEIEVQGHRCLVAGPVQIPDDAPVVFILHGLGANSANLFPLIEEMNLPPCRYILPDGIMTVGPYAYGWYDLPTNNRADMVRSRDYLFGLMRRFSAVKGKPNHPRPIIVMGFSQGAVMSLEAGLNYKGGVKAIVSMGGYIWDPSKTLARPKAPLNLPILILHGTEDRIISENLTARTVAAVKQAGYQPIFKEYSAGHEVTDAMVADVAQFLQGVINQK